ncbi:MAG: MFS transporter [Candidatus Latescibacterota bacterium]|nr:MFS transporter [Candidatus Latescibacterota bacterium]
MKTSRGTSSMFGSFRFLRGNLLVLTVSGSLGMFCRAMVFPYVPLYILSLGGDAEEVGFVYAMGPLAGLLVFPLGGYLADRLHRPRMIAFTGYLQAACLLINVLAPSWEWIAAAMLLNGFAAFQFPASSALLADSIPPQNRGRGMATMAALSGTVALAAPWVAGRALDLQGVDTGMRILYAVMAAAYATGATVNLVFMRETREPLAESVSLRSLSQSLKSAYGEIPAMLRGFGTQLRALSVVLILCFVINATAGPFWVIQAKQQIGLTSSQWGLILLVETAVRNLATVPAGFLCDRRGRTPFIFAALLVSTVTIAFLFVENFHQALVLRCVMGIAAAFFSPAASALLADSIPSHMRGRVMAAIGRGSLVIGGTSGGVGGPGVGFLITVPLMLSALSGGLLYAWNPSAVWIFSLSLTLVALGVTAGWVRDPRNAAD